MPNIYKTKLHPLAVLKRCSAQTQAGFTLIELLTVVTLSVMITLSGTLLFLTTIKINSRIASYNAVKENGDYSSSQIEYMLRNAVRLVPNPTASPAISACPATSSSITLESADGMLTTFQLENDTNSLGQPIRRIASVSANPQLPSPSPFKLFLTSKTVNVGSTATISQDSFSELRFTCATTPAGKTYINVLYPVTRESLDNTSPVTQSFSSGAQLRNK